MKTQELFELRKAKQVPQKSWHKSPEDATNFYKPGFRASKRKPEIGDILGTIGDWLDEMGATKADIVPARAKAVSSPEYQKLLQMGFKDISTPGEQKAGTISLQAVAPMKDWRGRVSDAKLLRRIHINGNIRTHASRHAAPDGAIPEVDTHHAGRGKTYHPMTVKTHPDLSGEERLVGSMRASMKRLVDMYRKPFLKAALDKMQNTAKG